MSNSIWKNPDQKPDVFKPHTIMVVYEAHDEAELMLSTQYEAYTADRYINRWCYLDELLAQADKAERLQKQLDSLKKYSDSLRHRVEKMLKKNKTLKNTASNYFMKSIELGIELEKTKSNN